MAVNIGDKSVYIPSGLERSVNQQVLKGIQSTEQCFFGCFFDLLIDFSISRA